MLILTRRPGESVMIGENIVVTVLGVKGNQVRIGFDAPRETPIHRDEVHYRNQHKSSHALEHDHAHTD